MSLSNILAIALTGLILPLSAGAQSQYERNLTDLDQQFALLTNPVGGWAAQLRPHGSYLGIKLMDIDADRAKALKLSDVRGVEVTAVEEGSPAEAAGLRSGDVLLSYNGENVVGAQQFIRLVQETPQGRKIKIQLWRDGKPQTVTVTTGAPKSLFELPSNLVDLTIPAPRILTTEIPDPLMLWKNSLLGVECEPVDSQLAEYFGVKRGVLIRSVERGSAADHAGMKAGDVLIAMGNRPVATPRDVNSYMRSEHEPGKSIPLSLVRNHKALTLNITPDDAQ